MDTKIESDIKKIVNESLNAPSGSNSQPWKFKVFGDKLEIFSFPENDHPILNYHNRGTWVAHGALIENIKISSGAYGYKTDIKIFPSWPDTRISALVRFEESEIEKNSLQEAIENRCTNRKPFDTSALSEDQKNELFSVLDENEKTNILVIEEKEKIKNLCELLCVNEIVTLENKKLHELFFEEIIWDEKKAKKGERGLFLKTMELAKSKQIALRLVKSWPIVNFLNKFGFAKAIASNNAKDYKNVSLMGGIIVPNDDAKYIDAGRTLEKIWLKATSMGLSFHLIAGIPFFYQSLNDGTIRKLMEQSGHVSLLEDTYANIRKIFGNPREDVCLVFRIGFSKNPTSLSYKKTVEELIYNS